VPSTADIAAFLTEHHGAPVRGLEPLTGGFWSSAWAYEVGDDELVARFGEMKDGFEADRDAMAYASDELPVPEVLAIGDAPWGGAFAVSRRHHGRFLEDVGADEVERVRPMLASLLGALRAVPPATDAPSWRDYLLERLVDDNPPGWKDKLAANGPAQAAFDAAAERLRELIPSMPERRDLLHADLLHQNVLVSDDASRVTAVFSWKCSTRGDHLYDTAWCTFWGDGFHPGIAAAVDRTFTGDEVERHHCYELHIAATHLGWYAWTDDDANLAVVVDAVSRLTAPA
jgi:aminoglycoside phosphotransferase (APT) family kinase protein